MKVKLPLWLCPSDAPIWQGEISTIDNGCLRRSGGNKFLVHPGDAWSAEDEEEIVKAHAKAD